MLFRTHALFGILIWFILERFLEMPGYVFVGVLLGSVFVDLDSGKSRIGKKFWMFSWMFKHRGILHSLFGCFLFWFVLAVFNLWFAFGFAVGYLSHLLLDCFTFGGVRLFWPFRFKVKGFVRSGSWVEDVVFVVLLFVDFCLFLISLV